MIAGLFLYGLGTLIWLLVLSEWDVSKACRLMGLCFAVAVFPGFVLDERVGTIRLGRRTLIYAGASIVSRKWPSGIKPSSDLPTLPG